MGAIIVLQINSAADLIASPDGSLYSCLWLYFGCRNNNGECSAIFIAKTHSRLPNFANLRIYRNLDRSNFRARQKQCPKNVVNPLVSLSQ